MTGFISLIVFLLIIGLLVLVHELGHMLAAKWAGVKVLEFAIGFGPTLIAFKRGDTEYKLRAIPLGGYVRLFGDRSERRSESKDPSAYYNTPLYKKAIILMAGIFMNLVLAAVLSVGYLHLNNYQVQILKSVDYSFTRQTEAASISAWVTSIIEGSAAQGLVQPGDQILAINGAQVLSSEQFVAAIKEHANTEIVLTLIPAGNSESKDVEVKLKDQLGVSFVTVYNLAYISDLFSGVSYALDLFGYQASVLSNSVAKSINTGNADPILQNTGSVVAVGVYVNDIIAGSNLTELLQLTIAVSLALAFFNLLPIPVLDGGQLLIEAIEHISGRKIPESLDAWVALISFIIVFGLGIILMIRDVWQFRLIEDLFIYLRTVVGR